MQCDPPDYEVRRDSEPRAVSRRSPGTVIIKRVPARSSLIFPEQSKISKNEYLETENTLDFRGVTRFLI
jgi:hypothetical protein